MSRPNAVDSPPRSSPVPPRGVTAGDRSSSTGRARRRARCETPCSSRRSRAPRAAPDPGQSEIPSREAHRYCGTTGRDRPKRSAGTGLAALTATSPRLPALSSGSPSAGGRRVALAARPIVPHRHSRRSGPERSVLRARYPLTPKEVKRFFGFECRKGRPQSCPWPAHSTNRAFAASGAVQLAIPGKAGTTRCSREVPLNAASRSRARSRTRERRYRVGSAATRRNRSQQRAEGGCPPKV